MSKENNILFNEAGCLSELAIAQYIDGSLSKKELALIEKHIASCELCKDAIDGARLFSSSRGYTKRVDQMHQSVWRRSLDRKANTRKLYYGISSVAASLIVLFGIFFLLRYDDLVRNELETLTKPEIAISEMEDSVGEDITLSFDQPLSEEEKPVISEKKKSIPRKTVAVESDISIVEEYDQVIIDDAYEIDELADESIEVTEEKKDKEGLMAPMTANPSMKTKKEYIEEEGIEEMSESVLFESEVNSEEEKLQRSKMQSQTYDAVSGARSMKKASKSAYVVAEVMPMFQGGGVDEFNKFLQDSLVTIIPDSSLVESVIISFVVTKKGKVNKVKLISGTSSDSLNKLILDFVKKSPDWIPASVAGKPIDSEQEIEIVFQD